MSDTIKTDKNTIDRLVSAQPSVGRSATTPSTAPTITGFHLVEKLGETSTADVWSAMQLSLDRLVTIWVLKREVAGNADQADHFECVARAVSKIRHTNFVQAIDISRLDDGVPYVIFENVEGASLATILHTEKKFDQKKAAHIVLQIAQVLDTAWKQCGFVHRNIKPETVLLTTGDTVKITNYNSATLAKPGENPLAHDDGMIVGTPNYASPEQIDCLRSIDFHSDMYSTGALFYQMVTGVTPFSYESDPLKVLELQRIGTLENPRDLDPSIKPGVVHIIQRMMAKSPEDRYQWWQDVIEDLQRIIDGRPPYLAGANYVPPFSTVVDATTAGSPKQKFRAKRRVQTGSSESGRPVDDSSSPSAGPRILVKIIAVLLITAVAFVVAVIRVRDLESVKSVPADSSTNAVVAEVVDSSEASTNAPAVENEVQVEAPVAEPIAPPVESASETQATPNPVASEPSPSPEPATPVAPNVAESAVTPALSPQDQLLSDIFNEIKAKDFPTAKAYALKRFREAEGTPGIDLKQCQLIWSAFKEAASYEDLVGNAMTATPVARPISVGGKKFVVTPKMYAKGQVIGTIQLPDGTTLVGSSVDITSMSSSEMHQLVQSTMVDKRRPVLLSRAFLTLKEGGAGEFSILIEKYGVQELSPFLKFIGK